MNERYNRITGCRASVDAAGIEVEIVGKQALERLVELYDAGKLTSEVYDLINEYRQATNFYADALEQLTDAMRQ